MMSSIFLVLGIAVFGFALRSFGHPFLRKLGGLALLCALGLAIYGWVGNVLLSFLLALSWPLLIQPWLAILTQVRPLRLPLTKTLRFKTPPPEEEFPALEELSAEIEESGFAFANDTGWDWEEFTQFFRIFANDGERTQARVCVNQMEDMFLYYITLASWSNDGKVWVTTNDPWTSTNDVFSYGMVAHPASRVNRYVHARSFADLWQSHRAFLENNGLSTADLTEPDADDAMGQLEGELTKQLRHNLSIGLLQKTTENEVRYTLKGLFFVWAQALRDIVRLV